MSQAPRPAGAPPASASPPRAQGKTRAGKSQTGPSPALFLAGARSRLLPASVPFRYFGTAAVFQWVAWCALGLATLDGTLARGGLAWALAALHAVTLGVLAMSAVGASLQLLPVATRQAVRIAWLPGAIWWLLAPGVAAVVAGMASASPRLLAGGAVAVVVALSLFGALLARNLAGARGMPAVVLHGWGACVALLVVLGSAAALASFYMGQPWLDRDAALALHVLAATYGFMGLLALGLSYILLPMFLLASMPPPRQALASGALALMALALAAIGILAQQPALMLVALLPGTAAVGWHLLLLRSVLKQGLRKQGGPALALWKTAWLALALSLPVALAVLLEPSWSEQARLLLGWALVPGWLLSFVMGVLARILPFLASMHAARGQRRPPTPSALTAERPLRLHARAHMVALALLGLAIVSGQVWLVRAAALAGLVGATGFLVFFVVLMRRLGAIPAVTRT